MDLAWSQLSGMVTPERKIVKQRGSYFPNLHPSTMLEWHVLKYFVVIFQFYVQIFRFDQEAKKP